MMLSRISRKSPWSPEPVPPHLSGTGDARFRRANLDDADRLRAMHRASLRSMGVGHYSLLQIEGFLRDVVTVDEADLADGTFIVAEVEGEIAVSAAWTLRRPAYAPAAPADAPGPVHATIRAVFTHPAFTRRGLATKVVGHCEEEAVLHGRADILELWATLSGISLYRRLGYRAGEPREIPLPNGTLFPAVFMSKSVAPSDVAA